MTVCVQRLHLAEDRYRLQEEEIRLLELALEERESQVVRLEHRILYDRRLITAMRTELSAVRRKVRVGEAGSKPRQWGWDGFTPQDQML